MPDTTSINAGRLTTNCLRLSYPNSSSNGLSLNCHPQVDKNYFDIRVQANTFGSTGLGANERLKVQVGGLKNPREINSQAAFTMQAFASGERLIDESDGSQYFVVTMNKIGYLQSISVKPQEPRNGKATTYEFKVLPNVILANGDILYMTFPPEIALPSTYYIQCEGDTHVGVSSCIKQGTSTVKITLTGITNLYDPATDFTIYIHNVYNPVSFKPST